MAINDILKSTSYTDWYTLLNAIRSKHGVSSISYTNPNGSRATSGQMVTLKNSIESTRSSISKIAAAYPSSANISNINVGDIIKNTTFDSINTTLSQYNSVCAHNADYSNNSYDGDDGDDSSDCETHMGVSMCG